VESAKKRRIARATAAMTLSQDANAFRPVCLAPKHWRVCAVVFLALTTAGCWPFSSKEEAPQPSKSGNSIRITNEQMRQLTIIQVEPYIFRIQKQATGQIAFNEDASTVVLSPFAGRVTKLIAKIGDDVKRGDPLFEIDSPEVVQAQ